MRLCTIAEPLRRSVAAAQACSPGSPGQVVGAKHTKHPATAMPAAAGSQGSGLDRPKTSWSSTNRVALVGQSPIPRYSDRKSHASIRGRRSHAGVPSSGTAAADPVHRTDALRRLHAARALPPRHGYYATRVPGHGVGYATAPIISPWFGRLVRPETRATPR